MIYVVYLFYHLDFNSIAFYLLCRSKYSNFVHWNLFQLTHVLLTSLWLYLVCLFLFWDITICMCSKHCVLLSSPHLWQKAKRNWTASWWKSKRRVKSWLKTQHSKTLATWCKCPIHWKRPWCRERVKAEGEEGNRGWNGWMASLI